MAPPMEHRQIPAHQHETIVGGNISLIPYEKHHVPLYFDWLQDPHIQEMTATEPLDRETMEAYQRELAHSTNKFTKLIRINATGRLVGDVNVFFQPDEDTAELNIMIAEEESRQKGYAGEALVLAMIYSVQKYNVAQFFVKVLAKNEPGRKFFEKQGFKQVGEVDVFGEVKMVLSSDDLPRTNLCIATN